MGQPGVPGGNDSHPGDGWLDGPAALTGPAVSVMIAGTAAMVTAIACRRLRPAVDCGCARASGVSVFVATESGNG